MSGALALAGGLTSLAGGWRARLRRASFRGVAFHFDQASGTYGRRYAMHEYPGRDVPWAEDLGRSQRTWSFSAHLIGDFYLATRSALLDACEQPESGSLILPLIGRVEAVCTSVDWSDARTAGGYSALTIEFAEAGTREFPSGITDTRSLIAVAAEALSDAASGVFLDPSGGFNVGSGQSYVAEAAAGDVSTLGTHFELTRRPSYGYDQAPLVAATDVLNAQASTLIYHPPGLFEAVDTTFAAYTDGNPADTAFHGMLSLASGYSAHEIANAPLARPNYPQRREAALQPLVLAHVAEVANAGLFQSLVRRLALREIGYALPGIDLDNVELAEHIRDQVFEIFLSECDIAAADRDDASFAALTGLAHRILSDIDIRAAQLPALTSYRTPRSLNAITLAYQLYEDAERNLDIVDRVGTINPAFMPLTGRVLDR